MKYVCVCIAILVLSISACYSQEKQDVLYLKNGDIRKGVVIENVINDYVKIQTSDGSTFTIKYADIERIAKEDKPASTVQTSTTVPDAQKMMMYEAAKKSPTMGVLLSCLLTSAGHAYADNWGRGLSFTAGRVVGIVLAVTVGIEKKTSSGYYYTTETLEPNAMYYVGVGASLILGIWEMIDASAEVDRYNERLYEKIMGKPNSGVGMNLVPTKEGGGKLVLSYNF